MEPRRVARTVSDPKVRQVGFVAPGSPSGRTEAGFSSPPVSSRSPTGNSLSPVMIPPRRGLSDLSRQVPSPAVPSSPLPRPSSGELIPVGSYNPSEFTSSTNSVGDSVEGAPSPGRAHRGNTRKSASSLPSGGWGSNFPASNLTTVSVINMPPSVSAFPDKKDSKSSFAEKDGGPLLEMQNEQSASPKPPKAKTSKAERRALQEAQRAAKDAAKGSNASVAASGAVAAVNTKPVKAAKAPSQKNDTSPIAAPEKKGGDRPADKDRRKDVPPPRMQFDDKSRVEKAKKRAVVLPTEARNRVELFRHLPQYERGTLVPNLESKFFQLDPVHPAVYKVGLRYLSGDISGGNARCIAMLQAFQESIKDYSTPPKKALLRDLTAKINSYISFLIECRPLSISMGNAIRFLKTRIAKLPLTLSESEAKATLLSDIDRFINEKILLADKVIVGHAITKIRDGDVLLTYGSSSAVEMILLHAHEHGKQFRVVVVDSRPKLEGRLLLRRLVGRGLSCTYTHINAVSYIMREVTRVFLGASSILSNGTVYSRVGTACVAMVAHEFHVPVLVCCEAYKFHERVQLDSICSNELGDPDAILKVPGRKEINYLNNWAANENLQLLNLVYDATPSDYISVVITDYGMIVTITHTSEELPIASSSSIGQVEVSYETPRVDLSRIKFKRGADQLVPTIPNEDEWFCAPFLQGDIFWDQKMSFPADEGSGDFLYTLESKPDNEVQISPSSIPRFNIERGEYPYLFCHFFNYVAPFEGMEPWIDWILSQFTFRRILKKASIFEAIRGFSELHIARNMQVPATSVPVIVREYRREHLWI